MDSPSKNPGLQSQEVIIDIHVKKLKMTVDEQKLIRIIWKRGKKTAMTQAKTLKPESDTAIFDEKFQINTVLIIDEATDMPNKEKMSELTICLDKSMGGTELFKAELDMTKYNYGKFNVMKL